MSDDYVYCNGGERMSAEEINGEVVMVLIILGIVFLIALWVRGTFDPYLLGG
jgi:hypothetical protein